jgi:hypothetical protein
VSQRDVNVSRIDLYLDDELAGGGLELFNRRIRECSSCRHPADRSAGRRPGSNALPVRRLWSTKRVVRSLPDRPQALPGGPTFKQMRFRVIANTLRSGH